SSTAASQEGAMKAIALGDGVFALVAVALSAAGLTAASPDTRPWARWLSTAVLLVGVLLVAAAVAAYLMVPPPAPPQPMIPGMCPPPPAGPGFRRSSRHPGPRGAMAVEVREERGGRRALAGERGECLRPMDRGAGGMEARRTAGVHRRAGKRWRSATSLSP